jgi:hypothetical protein
VALGAEEIVTVLVTHAPVAPSPKPLRSLGEAVERTVDSLLENAYNVDRKLLFARNHIARLEGGLPRRSSSTRRSAPIPRSAARARTSISVA